MTSAVSVAKSGNSGEIPLIRMRRSRPEAIEGSAPLHKPRSVRDADVAGKRVLVRVDFNVPLDGAQVADDTRIRAALPTIQLLLDRRASQVILLSHLGRPKGRIDRAYSLRPVSARLEELIGHEVIFGDPAASLTVLENTRFDLRERENDDEYSRELAKLADIYVNDAFGSAHRAHASTEGVAHHLPAYAGLLLERELDELGGLLNEAERPFVAVLGGAKVADKIGVLAKLSKLADELLIGGKMAEELRTSDAHSLPIGGAEVHLPEDVVAAAEFDADAETATTAWDAVPEGWLGLDIGPATRREFEELIAAARTVFWNGPMGVFEWPRFAAGTNAVAQAVATTDARTVVGGGDSVRAIEELGVAGSVDWVSTGGGASLELLEGKELPGVAIIPEAD